MDSKSSRIEEKFPKDREDEVCCDGPSGYHDFEKYCFFHCKTEIYLLVINYYNIVFYNWPTFLIVLMGLKLSHLGHPLPLRKNLSN